MNYTVKAGDTLYKIARENNVTTNELLAFNDWKTVPSLQIGQIIQVGQDTLNENGGTSKTVYKVKQGDSLYAIGRKYNVSPAAILTANNLTKNQGLYIGQILKIPTDTISTTEVHEQDKSNLSSTETHTVDKGESLYGISRKYNTTPQAILAENGFPDNTPIYIGQVLKIPTQGEEKSTIEIPTPSSNNGVTTVKKSSEVYTVQQGDTLYKISSLFGISPQRLLELNGFNSTTPIQIGQQLIVKNGGSSSTPTIQAPKPEVKKVDTRRVHTVGKGESLYAISKKYNSTPALILNANGLAIDATIFVGQKLRIPEGQKEVEVKQTPIVKSQGYQVYTVQTGDYISKIASKFGVSPQLLVDTNHLPNGRIHVGQQLMIPSESQQPKSVGDTKNLQGRSIYQLTKVDGKATLSNGIKSTIGASYKMNSTDVLAIQNRLIQLGILSKNHNENANAIAQSSGGVVPGSRIPKTLGAIKELQNKYKLNWWVESATRAEMLGTNKFTYGVIENNDITFKFLREYTKYTLKFPHPITGEIKVAEFKNFVRSGYNQYYDGVGYIGKSLPSAVPLKVYTDVGLSTTLASAMQVVSSHEGNFDAINSYDKAFFSYGFIQFAGGGRGLAPVIARMKVSQPALFKSIFQNVGIDVTYTTRNNDIHQGELIIDFPGKGQLKGIEAEKALRGDHQLYGPFIRAAFHPDLVKAQIEQAVKAYAKPALGIKLAINTGSFSQSLPITDIINSAMGLGFTIDMTVNKWIVKTGQMFSDAINTIARKRGLHSYDQLTRIDEKEVIQEIVNKEGGADKRVADRGSSMLHSQLSSAKSPNKGQGLIA
ncbi:muramidase family protein [Flammeovirga kamogawensis]|uniref:LysM peptidoglycan-binding domain-containing protein n=1 Tax=Flammeovirga kamogawensis TaxID=373891 RepID=A0ABX8GWK7_9BACT|nr:LysM peptidoglycan-binding domain-containing protein [Flammeovirga kamogawensis]MBB6459612.1 peptidoglycan endopeptidase LytF [Flammeovirga kamogawensis]QWG07325.1 LysM peptidoglycan-binding domain-containing protein [Flammeovirga kamogawensis]TRX69142.1 LysM peptidoglycan-binding domain-containing protein [Flammeovirga kamogawensis]